MKRRLKIWCNITHGVILRFKPEESSYGHDSSRYVTKSGRQECWRSSPNRGEVVESILDPRDRG